MKAPGLRQRVSRFTLCVLLLAALLPLLAPALAQSDGGYDLPWSTVDGGGATCSSGGVYALGGTAGQPDGGPSTGGCYTLVGGFWGGGTARYRLYLPLVWRSAS